MPEELWFVLIFWFISIFLGLKYKQQFFLFLSALISIFLGFLTLINVYVWLGLTFIVCGIYIFYYALFKVMTEK